jgi:hypothetical protein
MLAYLKALASRLARRPRITFPPEPPDIGVREPAKRGPGGRSSAVAVDEPADPIFVRAAGVLQGGGAATRPQSPKG